MLTQRTRLPGLTGAVNTDTPSCIKHFLYKLQIICFILLHINPKARRTARTCSLAGWLAEGASGALFFFLPTAREDKLLTFSTLTLRPNTWTDCRGPLAGMILQKTTEKSALIKGLNVINVRKFERGTQERTTFSTAPEEEADTGSLAPKCTGCVFFFYGVAGGLGRHWHLAVESRYVRKYSTCIYSTLKDTLMFYFRGHFDVLL